MMKKFKFLIPLFYFLVFGCGVDTGNPGLTSGDQNGSIMSITDQISNSMCERIKTCFEPSLSNCTTKIRTAADIPATLGLNSTTYPNFDSIDSGLNNLTLQVDSTKKNACLQSISNTSCTATNVQQSYDSSDIENLTQAWKLLTIDSNCNQFIY